MFKVYLKGNAILFWDMKPDTSVDPMSLHGGMPVIKGTSPFKN